MNQPCPIAPPIARITHVGRDPCFARLTAALSLGGLRSAWVGFLRRALWA